MRPGTSGAVEIGRGCVNLRVQAPSASTATRYRPAAGSATSAWPLYRPISLKMNSLLPDFTMWTMKFDCPEWVPVTTSGLFRGT